MESTSDLGESFPAPNSAKKFAHAASGPGILVLSPTMQVLHVNRRALELAARIGQVEVGSVNSLLSTPVFGLCGHVLEALNSRIAAGNWDPFEVRRFVGEPERSVLLRGYGLPDRNSKDCSRVVMILEEDLSGLAKVAEQADTSYQPSQLEKAVA